MAIYIMALARGGFGVSGDGAWYDPRGGGIVRLGIVDPDDALAVTVEYDATPSSVEYEETGISANAPVIDGSTITAIFQAINPNGLFKLTARFSSGASKTTLFQAHDDQPMTDGAITADIDYGVI